ncbi:MAG: VOC family protein [Thermomicrobiales bacterium]
MTAPQTANSAILPAATAPGRVGIRVADLDRSLGFYRDLMGFELIDRGRGQARLGAAASHQPIIVLREVPGLARAPQSAAGLYHFAILLPSRPDLARFARHLIDSRLPFGQSDHTVSEALYFDDPDGNGIEVYADRPRSTWPVDNGIVRMTGDPIDFEDLLGLLDDGQDRWSGMPDGTKIGHVHLRVSDLERSKAFYVGTLGFDVTADFVRGALFVSAGGYHHHLGMNVWQSRGRPLAGEDVAGLDAYTIVLPDRESWEAVVRRLGGSPPDNGNFGAKDPDGISFHLVYDADSTG